MARARVKKSKVKKKKGKKSRSIGTEQRASRAGAIRSKLTKRAIIDKLVSAADEAVARDGTAITERLSSVDTRKVVTAVLGGLEDIVQKSVQPGSCGEFMLPGMFKVVIKTRPAIRKGTMVRNPGTGEMQPSQGKPARRSVKLRPLVKLKRAAAGEM